VSNPEPVRVLVLSVDPTISRLLRLNLERRGFEVVEREWAACCGVGDAPTPRSADVLIADLDCPTPVCWSAAPHIRALYPVQGVVLLAHGLPSVGYAQAYGPCKIVQKPFAVDEMIHAVGAFNTIGRSGLDNLHTFTESPVFALTTRERDVAMLIARGLTNRQIANELVIGAGTVANHVGHILEKLGCANRAQVAAWVTLRSSSGI
jgi:DNA-binding NarL/FixJ family response regulator